LFRLNLARELASSKLSIREVRSTNESSGTQVSKPGGS
jgi:hypothetical protein